MDTDVPKVDRAHVLNRQLQMLPRTWKAFCENGISAGTSLVLDYSYRAPSQPFAISLANALSPHATRVRRQGADWIVEGRTLPMPMSLEHLRAWIELMVDAGCAHHSVFDGFGAQLP